VKFHSPEEVLTVEQALERYQPRLESQIDLEPGLVLWQPFAAHVYIGWGDLAGLDMGGNSIVGDSYIRNRVLPVYSSEPFLRIFRMSSKQRVLKLCASEYSSSVNLPMKIKEGKHESAATIRERAHAVIDVLEAAGEEIQSA
jgi:hypothetical protein